MSHLITLYILALLIYQKISSLSQMSRFLETLSHDRLTDLLDAKRDGQKLLNSFCSHCMSKVGGWLILDDTVIHKPYSKLLQSFGWIYDHSQHKAVYGMGLVLLIWTDGRIRLPIAYKLYKKGGKSRTDLALELLSYARNRLKLKRVQGVLFDSWYSSKAILKRIRDYGWHFYTQVKSNRCFNGKQLKHYQRGSCWHETGSLTGGLKVLLIRRHKKFYITSNLNLEWRESYEIYRFKRQIIEEVFKIIKGQLCLCFPSDKKEHHWDYHIALVLSAFVVLESFRRKYNLSPYKMKEELVCRTFMYKEELLESISRCA